MNTKGYRFIKWLVRPFYRLVFRLRIEGQEHEPADGACLICANHISMHDIPLVGLALKRPIFFLAKAEVFRVKPIARFMRSFGVIPIHRGQADLAALHQVMRDLDDGNFVGIFPQGTRCPGVAPEETEIKSGVGMIAYRTKSAVLPLHIITKNNRIRWFRRIRVVVGAPISYEEFGFEKGTMKEYDDAACLIFSRICALGSEAEKGATDEH